ncbi:MAG TPA: DUF4760 domain-containing protein [Candidatus Baltobacteraceae bacterium]|jgi:hypothetical protein|nr:DUF4760 domain-containing protein [Candidatus Baltobacteraceae bacterium]
MSPEWLTAIGTLGTFVVIAASAIAALIQLRHMRGSNQIVALTECRETLESPAFQEAQRFVSYDLPERLTDSKEILRIAKPQSQFEGEYKAIDTVANFFENMGVFVKNRIIDDRLATDTWAFVILRNWNALLPVITFVREDLGSPGLWENFEYLAKLSERYVQKYPRGTYPAGFPRMPEDRSFIEAVNRAKNLSAPMR